MKVNNICCIGAGYVGGPTMAVIAKYCPEINVTVVDLNQDRIAAWNDEDLSKLPVYEPGLDQVVAEARGRNLFFSTDVNKAIKESEMIFMAVNTPTKLYGEGAGMAAEMKFVELCIRQIAEVADSDKIIVEKSTLPVRTANVIKDILKNSGNPHHFEILSNPEFLAEGTAIQDLIYSDRVLIGGDNTDTGIAAKQALVDIYAHWIPKERILTTNVWSSELTKLTANSFLAQRISSINAISELCEHTGANVEEVAKAMGMDSRIGSKFLKPSVGFGGSCFQKDVLNLVYIARSLGLEQVADYWHQVIIQNDHQKKRFARNIVRKLFNTVAEKKIVFLGWAFKKDTNDTRESAAIYVADMLVDEHAEIHVYDPKVTAEQIYADLDYLNTRSPEENRKRVIVHNYTAEIFRNAHAIAILTEWDEFKDYDYNAIYHQMKKPAYIFDGRNILDHDVIQQIGFTYEGIGN
ncbi:nucleotide sugar dehydrogenase [Chryseobacterium gossypii]|uniref:nucleotide sugar dehydrogenase n=1 Tax=Chryseobacterium gossypii TaxID=3231602 RepID=UPI0035256184